MRVFLSLALVGVMAPAVALSERGPAPGELPMELPELGNQRRVVMSQMRRAGFELMNAENDTLVFSGSPKGWPEATTTTYIFRNLVAEEVRLDYIDRPNSRDARRLYAGLKQRLSKWFGAPWLERLPAESKKATAYRTTWENEALFAQLASKHAPLHSVSMQIKRSAHLQAKREVEEVKGDAESYELAYFGLSTLAKEAAETLFDDFGELPMVLEGARARGKPLKVRLSEVDVPENIDGVDRELIERRFMQLTAGNWNLELTTGETDVDLRVALVPTRVDGKRTFSMRLEAYVDEEGISRKKVAQRKIYSASHRLN